MSFVEWEEKYSVHIDTIDEQHKHLIDLTNRLYEACTQDKTTADQYFKDTVKEAVEYVKEHFTTEEELMQKYGYPDFDQHKREHESFVKKILEYVKDFESGKRYVPNNFVRFLQEWLMQHIAVSDKKYEQFFRQQGVI